jgi:hypothetical protein
VRAKIVGAGVPGDLAHPRDEAVRLPIRVPVSQNADEHILNEVLAGHAISSETAKEIVERLAIRSIQNLKLIEIPVPSGCRMASSVRCIDITCEYLLSWKTSRE